MYRKSGIALFVCYCLIVATAFFYPKWKQAGSEATISWDASGYYWYLPAIFIYKDIKQCAFHKSILKKYSPTWDFQQGHLHESGNYVMKYSCGQAIAMLPWFTIAHIWALNSRQYPPDGFSFPYQFMISWGMIAYAFIGLWVLRKLLLKYYPDSTTALVMLALVFGTNYLDFSAIDHGMSHSSLFTHYCFLLYFLDSFYRKPGMQNALFMAFFAGLAVLTRPTELVVLLLILGWGISNKNELKYRRTFFLEHKSVMLKAAILFILVIAIQPIYWKYASGDWLVYSYGSQGFDWFHPHVKNYAFSGKSGWLRYTPMMFFAMLGMFFYLVEKKSSKVIIVFFAATYYLTAAWAMWDYGGNGGRAMIQYYPVLAFPMASIFQYLQKKRYIVLLVAPVFLLFIYLNIWYTYHAHKGKVRVINSSDAYYRKTVGRWDVPSTYLKLITNPDYCEYNPNDSIIHYSNYFDQDSISPNLKIMNGNKYYELTAEHAFYVSKKLARASGMENWIRVWCWVGCSDYEGNEWLQTTMNIHFMSAQKEIHATSIQPQMFIKPNKGQWVNLDVKPPETWDSLEVFFWNRGSQTALLIDSLRICSFE